MMSKMKSKMTSKMSSKGKVAKAGMKKAEKRPMNEYMTTLNNARQQNLPSFVYNGKVYKRAMHKHLTIYKA